MKKVLILAVAAAAGYAIYRKVQQDKAEQDLWNEAIFDDEVSTSPESGAPVVDLR
ncbi:MAG: DLW-39 family protein [Actinomycetes bacterium]